MQSHRGRGTRHNKASANPNGRARAGGSDCRQVAEDLVMLNARFGHLPRPRCGWIDGKPCACRCELAKPERTRERECVSTKNSRDSRRSVFIIPAPSRIAPRKNLSAYDDCASGAIVYNYFRDYDSATDRYLQSDPIGLRAGLNTFAYVDSSPITRIDPLGLMGFGGGAQPGPRGPMKCDVMCVFESKPDCRGNAQCEAANRAAGIRSSTETKYYGCACVLSLGLLGKGGLAYANSKMISAVSAAAEGGRFAGAAATGELLLNGPIGIGVGIVVGLAELAAKCEIRPTDNCCR